MALDVALAKVPVAGGEVEPAHLARQWSALVDSLVLLSLRERAVTLPGSVLSVEQASLLGRDLLLVIGRNSRNAGHNSGPYGFRKLMEFGSSVMEPIPDLGVPSTPSLHADPWVLRVQGG